MVHETDNPLVFRHSPAQRSASTLLAASIAVILLYTEMWRDDNCLTVATSAVLACSAVIIFVETHRAKLTLLREELRYRQPLGCTASVRFVHVSAIEVAKQWTLVRFSGDKSVKIPHGLHREIERLVTELESRSGVVATDVSDPR